VPATAGTAKGVGVRSGGEGNAVDL
jgi:hypothetical protein